MNKQFKTWPILRDVLILIVLSCLGGFIVGFASTSGHNSLLYIYSLALSNSLFCIIGFTISGCLAVENRWRHLAIVAAIVWAVSIFNVMFFEFTIIKWAASAIAVAIFALIGGGLSLLFKKESLAEISSNSGDEKLYEVVAREMQEKPLADGLWTKAYAEMGGDDAKARALYIKYRVEQLRNEAALEIERHKSETKRKAKEQRLKAEAALPPLKWYEKLANLLLGCFCGCVSLVFSGLIVVCLSEDDRANSGMSVVETAMVVIFIAGFAFGFGFISFKCFRAVMR